MTTDQITGILLLVTTLLVTLAEWLGLDAFRGAGAVVAGVLILTLAIRASWPRRVFILIGLALLAAALLLRSDWLALTGRALVSAAFIAAFFTALATLRNAAQTSPAIERCGSFLAAQPPGRRYAALTVGGHLFALILNYGAIVLLGTLAEANARQEPDAEIRGHRIRRMLLAIQRGFVSTLPWSPLAFATAISISLVPGATWAAAVPGCLVSALILAVLGWAMDTIFKPRLSHPAPARHRPDGSWGRLWPLLVLLAILVVLVGGLHLATGIRAVGVVMLVVPLLSLGWVIGQSEEPRGIAPRLWSFVTKELPGYRGELVILMMAGFIGTIGSGLIAPHIEALGLDLAALPGWLVLIALVWLIPLTGQLGMNPILIVSLIAPLLPPAAAMGLTPSALIVALTAGWALSGASSPFTATTLLVGALGGVSASHVGLRWNGAYTLISAALLSLWVALYATL